MDISLPCSEGKMSDIESLPDDVVFTILVRVPAQDIYRATRLVCRKWYKMIHTHNFVIAHDHQHSTCGLVVWNLASRQKRLPFVAFQNDQVEVSSIDIKGEVISSCNGLILESHGDSQDLCIMNPATKQHFSLPPFLEEFRLGEAIAYDATSKVYKVVRIVYKRCRIFECAIFTVGVDKDWTRLVDIEHLLLTAQQNPFKVTHAADGFVYWSKRSGFREKGKTEHVLILNVETEVITQFPVPVCDAERLMYYYLTIGSYLYLMIGRTGFFWEAWEMDPESGEWTMMATIDLEAHQRHEMNPRCRLLPVGWLKFREVLVFRDCMPTDFVLLIPTGYTIAYNCRTHSIIGSFELDSDLSRFHVHRNSLIWIG